ncbi:tetratricopeptide repeat protein [Crocinitomicaceae bacterium]|nr:tetratricopeptide repeat protein [Crocinitomicaceae bacterium]
MFICQTPGCAIAISKASFPAEMPCPVCQKKLVVELSESSISDEENELIASLPYLIAYPLENTLNEDHAWTKINLLKDTLLNYLKFLGLLSASEFFNSPFKDKNIISSFYKNLSHPSFGSWNAFTRETLQFLKENNHTFFCPELIEYYEKIETGKKRKLYNGEIEIIDARGETQIKKQQATGIGMLINFRNRYLGHGLTLDADKSQDLWSIYFPIFKELLEKMHWCENFVMYKNEGQNTWKLQGAQIQQVEVPKAKEHVWIQHKEGGILNLVPFFIIPGEVALGEEDTKMLTYESFTGKSIKFFSPEGIDKTTSGRVLERLNIIIKDKQEETPNSPENFTKELFLERVEKENQFILQTLLDERKVIEGIYQNREDIEVKLRSWIGSIASVFFIAAEAGSGKTNLLVEIQKQYKERGLSSLLIRPCRMAKQTLKEDLCYLLNINENESLSAYHAIAGTQNEPFFLLIDGINESAEEQTIWKEIKALSQEFKSGVLKTIVTCRVNSKDDLDRFKLEKKYKEILHTESQDEIKSLTDVVSWLTPLNMLELEHTWNTYTTKNKKITKPQFKFKDIGDYDRGLYEKIKNPLILRIFLETYHNKPLPKKGKKKLNIWRDWLASFHDEEIELLKLLAREVWQEDKNELELESLLSNDQIGTYLMDSKVSAPYQRLVLMGWLSRYNKDNTVFINFTVEGLLFYLLGENLAIEQKVTVELIEQYLNENSVIKKSTVESYLISCADKNETTLISDLIDHKEATLEITIPALTEYAKTFGAEKTIETLFENPSDLDWLALSKLSKKLHALFLVNLRRELLLATTNYNTYSSVHELTVAFKTIGVESDSNKQMMLQKINKNIKTIQSDIDLVHYLSDYFKNQKKYLLAIECLESFLNENDIENIDIDKKEIYATYYRLAENISLFAISSKDAQTSEKFSHYEAIIWIDKAIQGFKKIKLDPYNSLGLKVLIYNNMLRSSSNSFKMLGLHRELSISPKEINLKIQNLIKKTIKEVKETNKAFNFNYWYDCLADTCFFNKDLKYDDKNKLLAQNCYERAIEINMKLFGRSHPKIARSYENLASYYQKIEGFDNSIKFLNSALEILTNVYGNKSVQLIGPLRNFAETLVKMGDANTALEKYEEALRISKNHFGLIHQTTAILFQDMGKLLHIFKDFDKSNQLLSKAKDIFLKLNDKNINLDICEFYLMVNTFTEITEIKIEKNRNYNEAIIDLQNLLKLPFFKEDIKQGGVRYYLGVCYENINEIDKAFTFFMESAEIRKKQKGIKHDHTQKSIADTIRLAKKLNKENELPDWITEKSK